MTTMSGQSSRADAADSAGRDDGVPTVWDSNSAYPETSDPVPVERVAEYLLLVAAAEGGSLSCAELQETCYYAQAWHLADWGRPLFDEQIEACEHGPRIPALDAVCTGYGDGPIPAPSDADLPIRFSHWMQPGSVLEAYFRVANAAFVVVPRPHGEEPWQHAYRTGGRGAIVDRAEMTEWAKQDIKQMLDDTLEMTPEECEARKRADKAGLPFVRG